MDKLIFVDNSPVATAYIPSPALKNVFPILKAIDAI